MLPGIFLNNAAGFAHARIVYSICLFWNFAEFFKIDILKFYNPLLPCPLQFKSLTLRFWSCTAQMKEFFVSLQIMALIAFSPLLFIVISCFICSRVISLTYVSVRYWNFALCPVIYYSAVHCCNLVHKTNMQHVEHKKMSWLCFYQTRSAWSVDQGSNKNHSPAYNFAPTVTKFCVMWEGLSLPHDTKFGNCRCKTMDSRAFPSWSLIHGLCWSGLIKAEPGFAKIVVTLQLV